MKKILLLLVLFIPIMFVKADIKEGKFTYYEAISDKEIKDNYYYDDNYFEKSSYLKNDHLRTFSLTLTLEPNIMTEIGLSNIKTSINNENKSIHTVRTTIGYKKIKDYNLIIISIKNEKNEEWASNFTLGNSGNAKGFDEASKSVINDIKSYIKENNLKNNKLFITGYSRSGGVSNLVGIYINEHLNEFNTKANNLFVYTFEAPNSSNSKKIYKNIHNVINHNDLVTYVAPKGMGFNLNGIEEDITTPNKDIILKYFETSIKDGNKINQKKFLKDFFKFISDNITREEYTKVESDISDLVLLYVTMNKNELDNTVSFFKKAINDYLYDENGNLNSMNGLNLLTLLNSDDEKVATTSLGLLKNYLSSYEENSKYIKIEEKIINIYKVFQKTISKDYNKKINGKSYPLYYVLTFTSNFENLVTDHYLSTIWESVKSKDSYYLLGPGKEYNNDKIEILGMLGLLIITISSIVFIVKFKNK